MVLQTFEGLGFCKKGEGGPFVADGRMRLDGALPTNTDGGGLSHCHPGMRGMFLLVEAARQLRGEAHGRQVENAKLCCVSGTGGWFSSAEHRHSRRGVIRSSDSSASTSSSARRSSSRIATSTITPSTPRSAPVSP